MPNLGKVIKKASFSQRLRIFNLLKEHLEPVEDQPGAFRYKNSTNDDEIAAMAECGATAAQVAGLRRSEFGNFPQGTSRGPNNVELRQRVEQIETVLGNMLSQFNALATKHDRLCQSLALNKVVNVKHLVMSDENIVRANSGREPVASR